MRQKNFSDSSNAVSADWKCLYAGIKISILCPACEIMQYTAMRTSCSVTN